jgi:hypothetical protein
MYLEKELRTEVGQVGWTAMLLNAVPFNGCYFRKEIMDFFGIKCDFKWRVF